MDKEVTEVLKTVRDLFLDKEVYLGGSQALRLALGSSMSPDSDVDIFILGTRSMASYLLKRCLQNIFDLVSIRESIEYKDYNIPNQIKLVKAIKGEVEYDLIFVDTDITTLIYNSSSDLGKIYYKVSFYGEETLRISPRSTSHLYNIKDVRFIEINLKLGSDDNIQKIKRFCKANNITYKHH